MLMIQGDITSLSPLHFGNGRTRGTFSQTLPYIPGRTIRGMIGWYLFQNDHALFDACGLAEDHDATKMHLFARNAYPLAGGMRSVYAPLKYYWCKGCQSLIPAGKTECNMTMKGFPCLQEGRRYTGMIGMETFSEKRLKNPDPVPMRLETKCPITRDGHTSMGKDWQLKPYHIQGIEPGVSFGFQMLADETVSEGVLSCLEEASYTCGLGGFRSRGYGLVDFSTEPGVQVKELVDRRSGEIGEQETHLLTLNSPCITRSHDRCIIGFGDEFFREANSRLASAGFSGDISPGADASPEITKALVRGWSLKNGNKVDEIVPATSPGSCITVEGSPQSLAALEVLGVGDLLSCGYGEVYISGGI
ncbi:MAG: RAMP superfamily CRISPR-associated protein [Methanospirillum sp.]|nr:RAMP superfamily CRISPR-associated protein [Methanospirillum sp.]